MRETKEKNCSKKAMKKTNLRNGILKNNFKKISKSNSAITLIVLVVTIIILLILAGVAISALVRK